VLRKALKDALLSPDLAETWYWVDDERAAEQRKQRKRSKAQVKKLREKVKAVSAEVKALKDMTADLERALHDVASNDIAEREG
jgi:uncharacterized protein YlxW (UPF0749 family)